MILTISEWVAYLPLIYVLDRIFFGKKRKGSKFRHKLLLAVLLVIGIYAIGIIGVNFLESRIDVNSVPHLWKVLRWNIHNIVLFLIFMIMKIRNNRKKRQVLFGISVISCFFALTQIVFYYYLFLSNLDGLTPDIIGTITLCSMAILFIQAAILELMERNINTQIQQNEEEKKLLEKKYEQDYYLLAMEQKENVKKLQEEMNQQLLEVQELIEKPTPQKQDQVQKILGDMEERIDKTGKVTFCKDSVLNTILALKYARAQKEGLDMDICVDSYARTRVEDFDMCSIVANLIDNAIEAANRVKENGLGIVTVKVHIGQRGGYLILKVENPTMESLKKTKKGRYISSKKETEKIKEHGRGIAIVENALKKYGGTLRFEETDGQIVAMAFLPVLEIKNKG